MSNRNWKEYEKEKMHAMVFSYTTLRLSIVANYHPQFFCSQFLFI